MTPTNSSPSDSQAENPPNWPDPHLMAALRRIIGAQRVISLDSLDANGRAFLYQFGDRLPLRHAGRDLHSRPLDLTKNMMAGDTKVARSVFRDHLLELIPADEYRAQLEARRAPPCKEELPEAHVYNSPSLSGSWWDYRRPLGG